MIIRTVRYRTEFLSRFAKFYVDISRCTVYLPGNIHTHAEHVTHTNGTKFAVNFAIVIVSCKKCTKHNEERCVKKVKVVNMGLECVLYNLMKQKNIAGELAYSTLN